MTPLGFQPAGLLTPGPDLRLFGRVTPHGRISVLALLAALVAAGCAAHPKSTAQWELTTLEGQEVHWTPPPEARAVVFLFLGAECPISNRAQPELTRLAHQFAPEVVFVPVYPNAGEDAAAIRRHRTEFQLTPDAFRDPKQHLADALGATVTPEVVALATDGRLIYRGRVNDQFSGLGLGRPTPTRHDLEEILKSWLSGQVPEGRTTPAAGCRIQRAS